MSGYIATLMVVCVAGVSWGSPPARAQADAPWPEGTVRMAERLAAFWLQRRRP